MFLVFRYFYNEFQCYNAGTVSLVEPILEFIASFYNNITIVIVRNITSEVFYIKRDNILQSEIFLLGDFIKHSRFFAVKRFVRLQG